MPNKITDYLPRGASAASLDRIRDEIIRSFVRAERELSLELLDAIKSGKLGDWRSSSRAERLVNVRRILSDLDSDVTPLIRPLVDAAIKEGGASGLAELAKIGKDAMQAPQAVYEQAVATLAEASAGQMQTGIEHVARIIVRTADDVFSRVGRDVAMRQLAGSLGSPQAARSAIIRDLRAQPEGPSPVHPRLSSQRGVGRARILQEARAQEALVGPARGKITAFVDKSGRRWSLSNYADMVSRTTAANAVEEASRARYAASGVTLIVVSSHPGTCDICAPFEGTVISTSGTPTAKDQARLSTLGYDLTDAGDLPPYATNGPPFHPRCSHTAIPLDLDVSEALGGRSGMNAIYDESAGLLNA